VRILIQTGRPRSGGCLGASVPPLVVAVTLLCGAGTVEAQTGQIRCSVTENGSPGRGTIVVEQDGREVGGGSCGATLSVPAGKCKVTVRLDGTLDNPSKSVRVEVSPGKATPVSVDFQTGVLEVRIETKGHRHRKPWLAAHRHAGERRRRAAQRGQLRGSRTARRRGAPLQRRSAPRAATPRARTVLGIATVKCQNKSGTA